MEACCLTSNSFTKTIEFGPSIKARTLFNPKRCSNQFVLKRVAAPSSISCCHSESSSPSDDKKKGFVDADWRSFRARLVAEEQAASRTQAQEPSAFVDLDTVVDSPPPQINIGDRWAHEIHEPEKGCLLIATEKLDGVHIFERTVILLLSTEPIGPSGIILNRPSLMSIKEMRSTTLDVAGTFSDRPLFFGGPLDGRVVFAEMVKRNVVGPEDFRFFDGCCGWEKEQLNEEIRAGYWTVAACSPKVIGLDCVGSVGLWDEILGLMGPRKVW
ncbi:hypothetical protein Patl1_21831 [Pistacia atlantica]|uniref:Uncharacterized protein n=1 Tax=Pistacia atlantica TaxID=434234 RepID=A0ACC1BKZ2_9ROSI|nr:hypothetical protein Patl1_21831 [Pistacia atlantica]